MTDTTPPEACPFCGGEAAITSTLYGYPASHWVKCGNCGACSTNYSNRRSALTAWNTRANADARLVEALRAVDALLHEHGYEPEGTMRHTIRAALSEVSHG